MGLLKTYPLNQRLVGYLRAEDFEDKIREISGKSSTTTKGGGLKCEPLKAVSFYSSSGNSPKS